MFSLSLLQALILPLVEEESRWWNGDVNSKASFNALFVTCIIAVPGAEAWTAECFGGNPQGLDMIKRICTHCDEVGHHLSECTVVTFSSVSGAPFWWWQPRLSWVLGMGLFPARGNA